MGRGIKIEVTEEKRAQVEAMAGLGLSIDEIAIVLGMAQKSVRNHFKVELARGAPKANAKVAESLYKKATGNGPQSVAAAIFWMKTRARWTTIEHVHVTGLPQHDGPPRLANLRTLSVQDLRALDEIAERLEAARNQQLDGEGNGEGAAAPRLEGRSGGVPTLN